jgi:glyoxylase-like metal-dependent hydrolase (beta-lactamase superfamily II)
MNAVSTLGALLSCAAVSAAAVEVTFRPVSAGVYAYVGETGPRTAANEGLNANLGLIVAPGGAILIDSGATFSSARDVHAAVKRVTAQPVKWVINTGGQDHRWLGNGYFAAQGAEIIAHTNARADMQARGGDHLQALRATLRDKLDGTVPVLPTRWIAGNDERIELGGASLDLRHRGAAHTPGDMMVRIPNVDVVFTGDVVYVERMLGVIPVSNTRQWIEAFDALAQWNPKVIVPGHGSVTDLAAARSQTRDYLAALRAHMKKAVDDGTDISAAIKSFPLGDFGKLLNASDLHPGNASRTYLEIERE